VGEDNLKTSQLTGMWDRRDIRTDMVDAGAVCEVAGDSKIPPFFINKILFFPRGDHNPNLRNIEVIDRRFEKRGIIKMLEF
jgi:hypothetical protein